ncbi:uncharacterized protein [Branchiostoma lanceolatum]|uniref:uncharacterized protein isoform X2 n=1 Tax=Branchiostoma lanceolatum TaxID=7740 RepID=UPI003454624B
MAAEQLSEIRADLTCPICTQVLSEPKALPCLHTYCCRCLLQLEANSAQTEQFPCPECRQTVILPERGVRGLPTNFMVANVVAKLRRTRQRREQSEEDRVCARHRNLAHALNHTGQHKAPNTSKNIAALLGHPQVAHEASLPNVTMPVISRRHRTIQQRLVLLLHAQRCQASNQLSTESGEAPVCQLATCRAMRNTLDHIATCQVGQNCSVPHCTSSQQILSHWKGCRSLYCPVCLPLKTVTRREEVDAGIDSMRHKLIQRQLTMLLHARTCRERERAGGVLTCRQRGCGTIRNVLAHMDKCQDGTKCKVTYCASSTQILSHWKSCRRHRCPVCQPLRGQSKGKAFNVTRSFTMNGAVGVKP